MTLSDALDQFSSFHDAELLSLTLDREDRKLTVLFSAHDYGAGAWRTVRVTLLGVSRLSVLNTAISDPAFSEYVFPLAGLVADVSLPDPRRVVVHGADAWAIDCEYQESLFHDITR